MAFDNEVHERVRKAVAEGHWHLIYTMVPAMDGGQSYEMKCQICGAFGNVMASTFDHAKDCPVEIEEKNRRAPVSSRGPGPRDLS